MNWWIIALFKKILSILPLGSKIWNFILISSIKMNHNVLLINLQSQFELINTIKKYYGLNNKVVLEIGTGRTALGAFCLYLCDVEKIITIDINKRLNKKDFLFMITYCNDNIDIVSKESGLSKHKIEDKINRLDLNQSLTSLLTKCNIIYKCPYTFEDIKTEHFDIVFSVEVLEHLNSSDIYNLAKIKPDKLIQAHQWAQIDHFAFKDKSITKLNFLKFSDFVWEKIIMNSVAYQNRLRENDIINIFESEGYSLLHKESHVDLSLEKELKTMKINKKFESYSVDDLLTTSSRAIFEK